MDNPGRKLKRNEIIFAQGDLPQAVYMVQTGRVGLMVDRGGKPLEIASLGPSQVFGEQALFSTGRQAFTAQALQESRILEVPIELMKVQFERCPTGMKLLVKSLVDDMKLTRQQMKQTKLETEKAPCPQGVIHKLFTEIHLIARHIGKKDAEKPNTAVVAWNALKMYANRFFGESPQRLRSAMDLLAKLKLAELKMSVVDDEDKEKGSVEELTDVTFLNLQLLENFAEFYQYHLFKGSRAEAIYVDKTALKAATALAELSEGAPVNHKGASVVDYNMVLAECKNRFKFELKSSHLEVMEKKGLFAQRKSFDDGRVEISFDRNEFVNMSQFWAIIHEIDKWNERGQVVMVEKEEPTNVGGPECPACNGKISTENKFCPHCGHKIAAAA